MIKTKLQLWSTTFISMVITVVSVLVVQSLLLRNHCFVCNNSQLKQNHIQLLLFYKYITQVNKFDNYGLRIRLTLTAVRKATILQTTFMYIPHDD